MNNKQINSDEPTKKKIYYAWNYVEWGGVQIYFLGLMRSVSKQFSVKAILPAGSDKKILNYLESNNIGYDFFKGKIDIALAETVWRRIKRRTNDFTTNLSMARYFSRLNLKDSIVQIDVAPWAGFVLLFYLTLKTTVFVTFHTAIPEISFLKRIWWRIKFAILTASKRFHIAASNLDVKKSLRPFLNESRYRQIEVVYSSFNAEEIAKALKENVTRQEIARKYNFPAEKKWICNVAQFIERKGCWVFLEAIEILQKQRSDLFFYWLGTAPLPKEIREKIEKFNLKDDFRFLSADETGSRTDLLTLWKAADLFVLPSFQEGLPVALIEAMALGKACIASEINAIPEAVKDSETGRLVKAGDSLQLAQVINDLADDVLLQRRLGDNARKFVIENFEEKVIGQKMLELYGNSGEH